MINIYCDESCHLEHDNSNVMVLEKRKDEFFLITAYCVIYDIKRNELKKKAEKQKRQQ